EGVSGTLSENDALLPDGTGYQQWRVALDRGETVVIDLQSADFDPFLSIGRMAGDTFEELDANDDFGAGTDSRLTFSPPAAGEYLIRVRPYLGPASGSYSLTVQSAR